MSETIFVVTEGDYSDYHICGVFTDKEKAELFKCAINGAIVEEYELNPSTDDIVVGRGKYNISMAENGDIDYINMETSSSHAGNTTSFNGPFPSWKGGKFFAGYVFAYSQEEAIKIAGEKRREYLALNPPIE